MKSKEIKILKFHVIANSVGKMKQEPGTGYKTPKRKIGIKSLRDVRHFRGAKNPLICKILSIFQIFEVLCGKTGLNGQF